MYIVATLANNIPPMKTPQTMGRYALSDTTASLSISDSGRNLTEPPPSKIIRPFQEAKVYGKIDQSAGEHL